MKTRYTELQTKVIVDRHTLAELRALRAPLDNCLVRQCVALDPITHRTTVEIYTDDGAGNGELLYKFELE